MNKKEWIYLIQINGEILEKEFKTKKEREKYLDTLYLDNYDELVLVKTTRKVEE